MRRARHLVLAALLAAAGLAVTASAQARPWSVRTVKTTGPAFHRDLDVLPDGRTALLLQRPVTKPTKLKFRRNWLELRIGRTVRTLDFAGNAFDSAAMDHDRRGRVIAAWAEPDGAGAVSTWIAERGGIQQIGVPGFRVTQLALDVAPDGYAVLAFGSYEAGVFVVQRRPGRDFSAAQQLFAPSSGIGLAAGVARGGRTVVAWSQGREGSVALRASDGAGPFGPLRTVALGGRAAILSTPRLAMTADGRAVVAVSTYEVGPGAPGEAEKRISRVHAFDWSPSRASPSSLRVLSRGAAPSEVDVLSRGRAAIIAWTQRAGRNAPRTLRTVSWTARGPGRPHRYKTRRLGIPVALTPAPGRAADVFYGVRGGHWFTVRITQAGLFRNTTPVTPPNQSVSLIDVAGRGRRAAAAWTVMRGRTNASWRVQVAHPR